MMQRKTGRSSLVLSGEAFKAAVIGRLWSTNENLFKLKSSAEKTDQGFTKNWIDKKNL